MRAERRDRLRRAYSDCLTALDRYQNAVPVGIETPSAAQEDALVTAEHYEAAAFSYVLLLDPNESRIARAKRIREDEWWDSDRIAKAEGRDLRARIGNVQCESMQAKHEFARYLCGELKEPV